MHQILLCYALHFKLVLKKTAAAVNEIITALTARVSSTTYIDISV